MCNTRVMPVKNTIKTYIENGYYHIYNRGIDKREIFLEERDCIVFLHYLKLYLSTPENLQKNQLVLTPKFLYKIQNLNLSQEIDLLSFTLMPNHFHLQVKQKTTSGIEKLTRRVLTSYSQFFNNKYKRKGTLFESAYKAVLMEKDEQLLYLSSYIHRNPMRLKNPKIDFLQFSSYPYYLGYKKCDWIKPDEILSFFRSSRNIKENDLLSYQNFVESIREEPLDIIGDYVIESTEDYYL